MVREVMGMYSTRRGVVTEMKPLAHVTLLRSQIANFTLQSRPGVLTMTWGQCVYVCVRTEYLIGAACNRRQVSLA